MAEATLTPTGRSLFKHLPRKRYLEVEPGELTPPQMRLLKLPKPGVFLILRRLGAWGLAACRYQVWGLRDRLAKRRAPHHMGIRLRRMFEGLGGTATKIGQQLAVRIDLLPYEACAELSKMYDHAEPFATEYAIERIEAVIGLPLEAVFASFDPEPIGAASIACVYQAMLKDERSVAIKVRRPDIDRLFAADLRAIGWVLNFMEMTAAVRPGLFKHLRTDLHEMLLEELDFIAEARYQRLFRRKLKKHKIKWATAPKVYHCYCGDDVIVSEFIEGVPCLDILTAVETGSKQALAQLAEMKITPKKLSKHILWISYWGQYDSLFFHADPHPGNIIVRPNSKIVLVDFGACGTTTRRVVDNQRTMLHCLLQNDVSGATEAMIQLMTPLPAIDIKEFTNKVEAKVWRYLFAITDKKAEWHERTSAGLWLTFMELSREYQLQVNLDTVRMIRSTLLYDTLGFRLWRKTDLRVYARYERKAIKRRAKRTRKQVRRTLNEGAPGLASHLVDMGRSVDRLRFYLNAALGDVLIDFQGMSKKSMYIIEVLLKFGLNALGVTAVVAAFKWFYTWLVAQDTVPILQVAREVSHHPLLVAVYVLLAAVGIRRILFRIGDVDKDN